jgi:peptidoglycan/xylan/chitin deacetylase (PgdA/CDA1 family)
LFGDANLTAGRDLEDIWRDHFDYFYREYDEFIFPMTIHPDASGRPHALLMHERLIEHINKHEGVEWVTMEQVCLSAKHPKQVLRTNDEPQDV